MRKNIYEDIQIDVIYELYVNQKTIYNEIKSKIDLLRDRIFKEIEPDNKGIYKIYRIEFGKVLYMEISLDKRKRVWSRTWEDLKPRMNTPQSIRECKLTELLITDKQYELGKLYYDLSFELKINSYDHLWSSIQKYVNEKLKTIYKDVDVYNLPKNLIVEICGVEYHTNIEIQFDTPYFIVSENIKQKKSIKID